MVYNDDAVAAEDTTEIGSEGSGLAIEKVTEIDSKVSDLSGGDTTEVGREGVEVVVVLLLMGSRRCVSSADTGIAACIVVFFAGSNASSEMADGFTGQIPDLANAEIIVDDLNAFCRAA